MAYNPADLKLSSYHYELDAKFIAERPVADRHSSKLLVYNVSDDSITHTQFKNLPEFLPGQSTLVLNESKVFPCRLLGRKSTGAKVEIFVLSLAPNAAGCFSVMLKSSGKKRVGDLYELPGGASAELKEVSETGQFFVSFSCANLQAYLDQHGMVPIPPYIRGGASDQQDLENYQTVYCRETGSVAAPTAGLHFTQEVFAELAAKDIECAQVTLHVGLGTFAPVKTDNIKEHKIHSEEYFINAENLQKIRQAKKVFAVGTTSLRVLESTYGKEVIADKHYATNIFLHPGVEVHSIAGLITNFHLPQSTLLMLVSSLIGREKTLELYEEAKKEQYRFFSYGDAMLIIR